MGATEASVTWIDDEHLVVGDIHFRLAVMNRFTSKGDQFCLVKPRSMVERYFRLIDELAPTRMVELGICKGGSTALLASLLRPEVLVAVDIAPDRIAALDELVESLGLTGRVHSHFGIDQSDGDTLLPIVDDALGGQPLDLVIDDASHDLELTRVSFELLFPRLRPGGVYVIEDWAWAHMGWNAQRMGDTPLTVLAFELIVSLPQVDHYIDKIEIDRDWVLIRKGNLELPLDGFAVADQYHERGRNLIAPLANASATGPDHP